MVDLNLVLDLLLSSIKTYKSSYIVYMAKVPDKKSQPQEKSRGWPIDFG
jgi:hypothetical protein